MVDHFLLLTAIRERLKSLTVATTGEAPISATSTGYLRTTGSFIEDNFLVGAEVTPIGFAVSTPGIITEVTHTTLTIEGGRTPEVSDVRILKIGLPAGRAWENMSFTPTDLRWYVDEDYIPGPVNQVTLGSDGELDSEPVYVIRLHGLARRGVAALYRVTDAILRLFLPNSHMLVSDGSYLYVKNSPAPFRGQLFSEGSSHAVIVITIPMWVRTPRGD
jgi:hypothetical protein